MTVKTKLRPNPYRQARKFHGKIYFIHQMNRYALTVEYIILEIFRIILPLMEYMLAYHNR